MLQRMHRLTDSDLAWLIITQATGKTKQVLSIIEADDLAGQEDSLKLVMDLLDESNEKMLHERMDDAYQRWERLHRLK